MVTPAQRQGLSPMLLVSLVALISMLAPFTIDTYLPSFPAIEADLGVSRAWLTQSLSIYLGFFALSTLVWGPLSDRFGRRKVVLVSVGGYLLASLLCALAQDYHWLLVGRALQGVMAAGSVVASRAMIRDYFRGHEAQKAISVVMMLFTVAPAIAPIIGGWLEVHLGWRSVFYFLAFYALMVWWLFAWKVAETLAPEQMQSIHPRHLTKGYGQSLLHPVFLPIVVLQGLLIGGFFVYVAASASVIFDHLHLQEQDFWRLFLPMVSGILIGSWVSHRLAHRFAAGTLIHVALFAALVAVSVNLLWQSLQWQQPFFVIAPLMLYAFGFALANPGLSILGLDCLPQRRGMAASLQSLLQMGTAGLVAALVVPQVHDSLLQMAWAQALMLLAAIGLWLFVISRKQFAALQQDAAQEL